MSSEPIELSQKVAEVVQAVGGSMVRVEARSRAPSTGVIWSSDGLIVTANHAIEREENIEIGFGDGVTATASLVGRDRSTDIALLRADASGLVPAPWVELDALRVGHLVAAVSRPGRTVRAALGIVSALGDAWRTWAGGRIDRYIEPDLGLHLGFSGSVLADLRGGALGMNTSGLTRGVGITVPWSSLRRSVEALLSHGRVRRGYLGIGTYPIRLTRGLEPIAGQSRGLLVVSMQEDSPAEKSGIVLGDILLSLGGKSLRGLDDLIGTLDAETIGTQVPVRMLRGGQAHTLTTTIGARG